MFNFGMGQAGALSSAGTATTNAGIGNLDAASAYWKNLLSGNRAAMSQAIAPETNATLSQADAAKRQMATSGTARGGGTASTGQQVNDQTRALIDNALFALRPQAAQATAQIGTAEAGVGVSELNDALNALGISGNTATNIASIASGSRAESNALNQQTAGDIGTLVGLALSL